MTTVVEEIRFLINGEEHLVPNDVHPATRLSDYLRQVAHLKGTKVMCREGGCGACVVSVRDRDPVSKKERIRAINSCLCPITTARGWHVVTTEGLGGKRDGFHPIQQRLADYSATQCGFCTPGFVMSMYSLLGSKPDCSSEEIERSLDGNLCRCTGYRSILDACKSFAKDGPNPNLLDIEDLQNVRKCKKSAVIKPRPSLEHRPASHRVWQRPQSLDQLYDLLETHQDQRVRLVMGNTATGVFKNDRYNLYLDIRDIDNLYRVKATDDSLEIGSNITLTDLQEIFCEYEGKPGFDYLKDICKYIDLLGNKPIRNAGTWAGNLVLQHDHPEFVADMYTPLEAVGAKITLGSRFGQVQETVDSLMSGSLKKKVILSVTLPALGKDQVFGLYKVMPRAQSAHSYVNAGFSFQTEDNVVISASVVFGGLGPDMHHATHLESFVVGKNIMDPQNVKDCLDKLSENLKVADDPLVSIEYKADLAKNLLFKFLCGVTSSTNCSLELVRPLKQGSQEFETNPEKHPITQPVKRWTGELQCSGEASYLDDLPKLETEVAAVVVTSTIACGEVDSVDTTAAMAVSGAVDVVTAADIPGTNKSIPADLLSSTNIEYHGQPIVIVLADDLGVAYKMAAMVKITYKNVQIPLIDVDEAISKGSIHADKGVHIIGNPDEEMKKCVRFVEGKFDQGPQYHFCLENQACLVVPTTDGYDVTSASQWPTFVQNSVAEVLGLSANEVHVTSPRLGGGFGGKVVNSAVVATLCAISAHKTRRPVRLNLGLDTSMKIMAHRTNVTASYKVGLDKGNFIKVIESNIYLDGGHKNSFYHRELLLKSIVQECDGAYYIPNWKIHSATLKTNTRGGGPMRSPGQLPAHLLMQHIMTHVALDIGEDSISFMKKHLYQQGQMMLKEVPYPDDMIQTMWEAAVTGADVLKRQQDIQQFNQKSRWIKRGLAVSPSMYHAQYAPFFSYPAFLAVYHADGSVVISHGGVEMGQGLHTKVIQVASKELELSMEQFKVRSVDTLVSANTYYTAGSQTSEYICRTVQECCKILSDRLAPIKEQNPDADWKTLIQKAYLAGIHLAVSYKHAVTKRIPSAYLVHGVCVAEAEIDTLTGQNQILRTDLYMDLGESVNPAIDVGQMEGALVMGLGMVLREREVFDMKTGKMLTTSTWDYKPPTAGDIPADFRINIKNGKPPPNGVYTSKMLGEPPICSSPVFLDAVKAAVNASRQQRGKTPHVNLFSPATPEVVYKACDVSCKELM